MAASLTIQTSCGCYAAEIPNTAILELDMAPSSLPDLKATNTANNKSAPYTVAASTIGSADAKVAAATTSSTDTTVSTTTTTTESSDSAVLRGGVASSPEAAAGMVDQLTRQILLKLIELEKFNVHYTMEVAKQGRWKGWRYGLLSEANYNLGLAGAIVSIVERGRHIHSPKRVSPAHQEYANFIPMIGNIIGASAAAMEFGINQWHDIQASRRGFSPKAATQHVLALKADIDRLLAERAALIKIESAAPMLAHAEVDDAEGQLLQDLRDQGLQEFERFHVGARRTLAFQQMQYFFDMTKNATGAIGYDFAYLSLHRHDRKWNYRAGVLFVVSGALTVAGPIVSRVFAKEVAELHKHRLHRSLQDAEQSKLDKLVADHAKFAQLCHDTRIAPDSVTKAVDREVIYGAAEKTFQDQITSSEKTRNKAKLTAGQNIFGGVFSGGSKIASGVLFMRAGNEYKGKGLRNDRGTNNNLFAASVVSVPASMYLILDTLRIQATGEIKRSKLKRDGQLPGQLAQKRLAQLDSMEVKLK